MKKLLIVVIFLLVAILMVVTVPEKRLHKEAMMEAVEEFVAEEAEDRLGDNVLSKIGKGVVVKTAEVALNSKLRENNYYLFNTTYVRLKGEDHLLSVGLLGKVFTFDKQMLRDKLAEAVKVKEEAASEKEAAKESERELKRLKKEQRKREKELAKEQKRREKEARKEQKRLEKEARKRAKEQQ